MMTLTDGRESGVRSTATSFSSSGCRAGAADLPVRAAPSLLQDLTGHDEALDLVGALVDLGDLGVAHHPLEREVARVAGAPEQLDGIGRDLHRDIGGVALGGRSEEGEILVAALRLGCRDVDHLARSLQLHRHVGDHELDPLEVGDALTELLALLDVGDRLVERALRDPDGLRADGDARVVEGAQGDLEPVADLADDAVAGQADIVEVQLAGRAALDPELALLLAERESLVGPLDDEGGDVAATWAVGVRH